MFNNRQGMQQPQTLQPPQQPPPFDWQSMMQQQRPMQPEAPQLPGVGQMARWKEQREKDPEAMKRNMWADVLSGMGR